MDFRGGVDAKAPVDGGGQIAWRGREGGRKSTQTIAGAIDRATLDSATRP